MSVVDGQGSGTINDVAPALSVSIGDAVAVYEGGSLQFTVTLSGGTSVSDLTIPLTYAGTADPVLDLDGEPVSVTILAGQTSATVTVPTFTDNIAEGNETVLVNLGTPPVGVSVVDGQGSGTINDVAPALSVSIGDAVAVNEGGSLQFTVTLSGGTSVSDLTIPLTYAGTADPVLDLDGEPVSVTILAGQTSATVTVPTFTDNIAEGNETVLVNLGTPPVGVSVVDGQGSGTINDVAPALSVSIGDAVAVRRRQPAIHGDAQWRHLGERPHHPADLCGDGDPVLDLDGEPVSVTILAGQTSATVTVPTFTDNIAEGNETVLVNLGTPPVGVSVVDGQGSGTINDVAPALSVSIGDAVAVNEGGSLQFTVTLSGGTSVSDLTIPLTYAGTADPVLDLDGEPVSVTILAGQTSATVTVPTFTDNIAEGNETVLVNLGTPPVGVSVVDGQGSGTINDVAPALSVSIGDAVAVNEGGSLQFTVTLSGGTSVSDLTIPLTYAGTADPVLDLDGEPVSVTILAGQTSATVTVPTFTDNVAEGNETVLVNLGTPPVGVSVVDGQGSGTINDVAPALSVSIGDAVAVNEGGSLQFTVTLSGGTSVSDLTIPLTYADGGPGARPRRRAGQRHHPGGPDQRHGDGADLHGQHRRRQRDGARRSGHAAGRRERGRWPGQRHDQRRGAGAERVDWRRGGGQRRRQPAIHGDAQWRHLGERPHHPADLCGDGGPGARPRRRAGQRHHPGGPDQPTVTVPTFTDNIAEGNETVLVNLGTPPVGVSVVDGQGSGTINDVAPALSVSIGDAVAVNEGGSLQFTVTLSGGTSVSDLTIPLTYAGTADPVLDLDGEPVSVTILAGQTSATVTVPTFTDNIAEGNETVLVNLGTPPVGVSVVDGQGSGTINDVAPALSVSIGDAVAVNEGGSLQFTVTLSGGTSVSDLTIPLTYAGTADPVLDLDGEPVSVTILAGQTSATVTVPTFTDNIAEGNETVLVNLGTPPVGVSVVDGQGSGTINDVAPALSVSIGDAVAVNEGGSLQFTVTLSGGTSVSDLTIPLTYAGTADPVLDLDGEPVSVTILAGQTSATVTVPTFTDNIAEGNETVLVNLGTPPVGVSVVDGQGSGTINDVAPALSVSIGDAVAVNEGGSLQFTVTLSGGTSVSDLTIPLTYAGTADPVLDLDGEPVSVTILAGQTSATVTVPTFTDNIAEGNETVLVNLGTPPVGVSVVDGQGSGTINDVAPALSVSIGDAVAVNEGGSLQFTVTLSGGTSVSDLTIPLTYAGTADPVLDLDGEPVSVTILAGQTSATVTVPTFTDNSPKATRRCSSIWARRRSA